MPLFFLCEGILVADSLVLIASILLMIAVGMRELDTRSGGSCHYVVRTKIYSEVTDV